MLVTITEFVPELKPSADGQIEIQVTHVVYRGAEWMIEARASDGTQLGYLARDGEVPQIGDTQRLGFMDEKAWIVADTEA